MALEHTRPRFRTDLVAQPLEVGGKRFIDVTDPDTEETFRFYEVEYSVACAMDGQRDVPSLIGWARDELGLEPEQDEVELVIGTLADLGYLSAGDNDVELGAPGPLSAPAPAVPLPDTSDVELGASGGTPSQRIDAVKAAEEVELGTAGKSAASEAPTGGSVTMGWDVPDVSALMGDGALDKAGAAKAPADDALEIDADMPPPPESAVPKATLKPSGNAASDEDGPTHIPAPATDFENDDVSVDLSDHLSIGTSDVKEAVRQSKVMQAVEIPADLAAAIESDAEPVSAPEPATLAAPEKKKPAPAPEKKPSADKSKNAKTIPDKPAAKDKPAADKKDDKKAAKPAIEPPPAAAKAPEKSSSGMLVFLILLLALGGGGAYWYFKIYKADDGAAPPANKTSTKPAEPAQPPKPPEPPPVVLAEAAPIEAPVGAVADGKLEWVADPGSQVEEGDVVAKFKGVSAVERSLSRPRRKLEEYSAKLDEAKAANNEGAIKRYEAKVDEKAQLVAAGEEQLAALTMTAPQAGIVDVVASVGASVKKGDPIVKVTGERGLSATLPAVKGKTYEVGGDCEIAAKKTPDKPIACAITAVEGNKVSIRIATDVGLAAGEAIILK